MIGKAKIEISDTKVFTVPEFKRVGQNELLKFNVGFYNGKKGLGFITCTMWNELAQRGMHEIKKDFGISVEGILQEEKWIDKTGQNKTNKTLLVEKFYMSGNKTQDEVQEPLF